jgi:peptidoglycan/LPS O-acetylase OafA/YrhL
MRLRYRSDIDGLRALAVLAVIVFHSFRKVLPGGFVGVDIFFVISGYPDISSPKLSSKGWILAASLPRRFMPGARGAFSRH